MQALILAGGLGTRMRRVLGDVPKAMSPIRGKPFILYQLEWLRRERVFEVILCTGYLGGRIKNYIGDGRRWGMQVSYSQEASPLGTAGALKLAALFTRGTFLVMNGDTIVDFRIGEFLDFHCRSRAAISLALALNSEPSPRGQVLLGAEGRVTAFMEKISNRATDQVNAGIYLVNQSSLGLIPPRRYVSLEHQVFPLLSASGRLFAYSTGARLVEIGNPPGYLRAQRELNLSR